MSNMRTVGDKVHSHNSNCIYNVANLEQRAVGFIPA